MTLLETSYRIEPCHLATLQPAIADLVAELSAAAAGLGARLHPRTAASLADMVRLMNCYYSNLIEGHNTRPRDIERALSDDLDPSPERRELQLEARAHVHVQRAIDLAAGEGTLEDPTSVTFLEWTHREFYKELPPSLLTMRGNGRQLTFAGGEFRSRPEEDVAVGRHMPPSSHRVAEFMTYFERAFRLDSKGQASRIVTMATAHHRLNFIHPFPDGNGRVSRLMSHAIAHRAGIGAHSLWSISRGLARGLRAPGEYRQMMDLADSPRRGDLDGRGNLSLEALETFVEWFLRVSFDQVQFMRGLFELDALEGRLHRYVVEHLGMKESAARLLEEVFRRGQLLRGDAPRATGLRDRAARGVLADLVEASLLESDTPKGPVSLRFPDAARDVLFPRLFLDA